MPNATSTQRSRHATARNVLPCLRRQSVYFDGHGWQPALRGNASPVAAVSEAPEGGDVGVDGLAINSGAVHWLLTLAGDPVSWSDDAKTYWNPTGDHWAWRDGDWLYALGGKPIGWISGDAVHDASTGDQLFSLEDPR